MPTTGSYNKTDLGGGGGGTTGVAKAIAFDVGPSGTSTTDKSFVATSNLINIAVTVTRLRKMLVEAIPESLQHAISAGIGLFMRATITMGWIRRANRAWGIAKRLPT